jgi:hypothetical protein
LRAFQEHPVRCVGSVSLSALPAVLTPGTSFLRVAAVIEPQAAGGVEYDAPDPDPEPDPGFVPDPEDDEDEDDGAGDYCAEA